MHEKQPLQLPCSEKVYTVEQLVTIRKTLQVQNKKLALTNGCFDLIHVGHLNYLQAAKRLADVLWVGLNSTDSIRSLKGPQRPILNEFERAYMLAGFECIDGIFFFNTPRLTNEILALQPDIYVKAGDYNLNTLNSEEYQALKATGAVITFLPFLEGYSSTQLIEKIKNSGNSGNTF